MERHIYECEQILAEAVHLGRPMAWAGKAIVQYFKKHGMDIPEDPFYFASRGQITLDDAFEYDRDWYEAALAEIERSRASVLH